MISFIVPAYNEESSIEASVNSINKAITAINFIDKYEIIIINDGSNDSSEEKILELQKKFMNVRFVTNERNFGLGFSIRRGIDLVKYDKFMLVPGDNAFSVENIISQLKMSKNCDVVIPYPKNEFERKQFRRLLSKLYCGIFNKFFNLSIKYINGTTIYPTKKVKEMKLISKGHGIISEMTTKLLHSRIKYCEIPIHARFPSRERSIKIKNLIDTIFIFIQLFFEIKIINRKNYFSESAEKIEFVENC